MCQQLILAGHEEMEALARINEMVGEWNLVWSCQPKEIFLNNTFAQWAAEKDEEHLSSFLAHESTKFVGVVCRLSIMRRLGTMGVIKEEKKNPIDRWLTHA